MNEEILQEDEMAEAAVTGEDVIETTEEANGDAAAPTLEEQLENAQAEAAKNLDGWLRAQAELANARKRFEKRQVDAYANATAAAVRKLLPIIDDFDRALQNVPETIGADSWFAGIELVQRKFDAILESFNVQVIDAVGQPFDPNLHEAIMQEESDEYDSGTVSRELQRGFILGDQVIRPSLVYVAA